MATDESIQECLYKLIQVEPENGAQNITRLLTGLTHRFTISLSHGADIKLMTEVTLGRIYTKAKGVEKMF